MSMNLVGLSDGRRPRAARPIRKLLALGLSEADVCKLMRAYRKPRAKIADAQTGDAADADKDDRVRLGQWATRTLLTLGFTESEIADRIDVDPTTIAHVLDPAEPRVLSSETVSRLTHAVKTAGAERLKLLLPRIPITVLDTCNDKGQAVDDAMREQIAVHASGDLQNALVFASAPAPIIPGVHAFLAQIGEPAHGLYLMKVPEVNGELDQQLAQLRRIEHELEHILERFREKRQRLEKGRRANRPRPHDGHIA